ncbi:hypothetical protein IJF86_02275 [Candidatus Saccharibacteria bacterium]|nr:hypothetical protein [Candidatus Saccharibacteria bacterium]
MKERFITVADRSGKTRAVEVRRENGELDIGKIVTLVTHFDVLVNGELTNVLLEIVREYRISEIPRARLDDCAPKPATGKRDTFTDLIEDLKLEQQEGPQGGRL